MQSSSIVAGLLLNVIAAAQARADGDDTDDRFEVWAHGETNAMLFQRALLPGSPGVIVETETLAPIRQDLRLVVRDIDTPWDRDSVDVQLAAWGVVTPGDPLAQRATNGDVQAANLTYRRGPMSLRLGRQSFGGGAARYVRFDGLGFSSDIGDSFDAAIYGGLTVLPLWNQRSGYYLLGSAADSLLRDPNALAEPSRTDHWLAGGRLGWHAPAGGAGVSVHEQQETGGVFRRNLGADGRLDITDRMRAAGKALFELDARRFADARVWVDANITRALDLSVEYFHAEPSLLLSRQSVLSVFSTAAYDEAGAFGTFRAVRELELEGASWVQFYDTGHPGVRNELAVKVRPTPDGRTFVRIAYARVQAPDNGYHSVRASLVRKWGRRLSSSLEAYNYFYDEAIRAARSSSVYTGTVGWNATDPLDVLLAATLLRSPYAEADAQAQIRLAYSFEKVTRR